jgi:hypothetical protein
MKKVFPIKFSYFWACNGRRINDVWYVDQTLGNKWAWMYRMDGSRVKVEFVEPPAGRCPHCGEKI